MSEVNKTNDDEFRPVPGYDCESTRASVIRTFSGKISKSIMHGGYPCCSVRITATKKRTFIAMHRLGALAWLPERKGATNINHKDGNKQNKHTDNLEWVTTKENNAHARRIGLNPGTQKKINQYTKTGELLCTHQSIEIAAKITGVHKNVIGRACRINAKLRLANKPVKITYCRQNQGAFIWEYETPAMLVLDRRDVSEWKCIGGTRYRISPKGQIYSEVTKIIRKHHSDCHGYSTVTLRINGKTSNFKVHVLVAKYYVDNPDPDHFKWVNHIDGNKGNPDASNLIWVTRSQNTQHAMDTGLNKCCKAINQYTLEGKFIQRFSNMSKGARSVGATINSVKIASRGKTACKGFLWRRRKKTNDISPYKNRSMKAVAQLDRKTGNVICVFPSLGAAAAHLRKGISGARNIALVCSKQKNRISCYGFGWKWGD
jgi:HNH endonuclease